MVTVFLYRDSEKRLCQPKAVKMPHVPYGLSYVTIPKEQDSRTEKKQREGCCYELEGTLNNSTKLR